MKLSKPKVSQGLTIILVILGYVGYLASCTNEDTIIEPVTPAATNELISLKVSTPPTLDGVVDPAWDQATKLATQVEVPNPENDVFTGYVGNTNDLTLRSLYDDQNIYLLAEWVDDDKSTKHQTWYFDPTAKRWKQESAYPTFTNSLETRKAFNEDKLAFLFNINKSTIGFDTKTCYATCHTNLATDPATGLATTPGVSGGTARHYTNASNERVDMWHWKSVRDGGMGGLADDQYQDNQRPNGRKSDSKVSGGTTNNTISLTITGTATVVAVPKYLIPTRENYDWIEKAEITAGTAKLVTAVDENGVLTLADNSTIDPNVDTGYQRAGADVGPKAIPFIITEPIVGNYGDISAVGVYTGTGWVVEIKRLLKTTDAVNQDVDFSSLEDQPFGVSIFDRADKAHGIKPNLVLKFKK